MANARRQLQGAFTLVELLIVIIVLAVLAAIAIPRFVDAGSRSKDAALQADMKLIQNAIQAFKNDTGVYPTALTDLAATIAPANGVGNSGGAQGIHAADYHGPYLLSVPLNPVTGAPFTYSNGSVSAGGSFSGTAPGAGSASLD